MPNCKAVRPGLPAWRATGPGDGPARRRDLRWRAWHPEVQSPAKRGAHFAQRLDYLGSTRLRPIVPIGLYGVDRAHDLIGPRLGEGIASRFENLPGIGFLRFQGILIPTRRILGGLTQLRLELR